MKRRYWIVVLVLLLVAALNFEYTVDVIKSNIIQSAVEDSPGIAPEGMYPVLMIHGFNPVYSQRISEYSMKEMQQQLAQEGYIDKGLLTSQTTCAQLRYMTKPIVVRATYLSKLEIGEIEEYEGKREVIGDKVRVIS